MAVAFVASSESGTSDTFGMSCTVPVPTGAASGHIAVVAVEQWEGADPAITPPSGFTAITPIVSGSQKLKIFWKRLTGSDTGNYVFTWTGDNQWSLGHCILISGGLSSGDPIEDTDSAIQAATTSVPSTTVTTATQPFLSHFVAIENSSTGTPPTNYTETRDGNYLKSNYRIPGTTGSHTASGGTVSNSTLNVVGLLAVKPESGGSPQTVVCNLLSTSSTVLNPAVIQIVAPLVISAPTVLFSPSVSPGSVTVQVPLISAPSTVFNPLVVSSAIIPTFLEAPSTLFEPSVIRLLQQISMMLLQASSTVYSPTITGGGSVEVAGSISDIARINMLADRGLSEPQTLSNVDLMRLVLADGAQTLVTETEATAAVHLWQYLRLVRDS